MNNYTLYDKEISVTFYREPEIIRPAYKSYILQGHRTSGLSDRRIHWNGSTSFSTAIGGEVPGPLVMINMEFYKGDTRRAFIGYRKDNNGKEYAVYKLIQATGNLYTVDTVEDMMKGKKPDGSPYKSGDRVRVKETGTSYSVYLNGGLSDADKNTIEEELATVLYLNCTNEGLKPDMSLTISLLPGQNCYNAVLKVRNLILADRDIRSWTRMVITAGYRTGYKATYTCPIFASYIAEPNPDGTTVFEGITVGTADNILNNQYIEITFKQEEMPLRELIEHVAQGIADGIKVGCSIADEIMNHPIKMEKQTVYAQNGMAVLSWLQTTVSTFIQNISSMNSDGGSHISAFVQLVDGKLQIIALNGPNKMPEQVRTVVSLDMVSGATFNGTALTVTAPWNPVLQPGNLFYMPPEFINGSKLPNVLPEEDYRNEDNLYRALTMSVAFASVENTNRMEILAVPAQWAGELPTDRTTSMRGDLLARALSKDIADPKHIDVGNTAEVPAQNTNNIYKTEADTQKKMFDDNRNIFEIWGAWTTTTIDSSKGNCLSQILEYYFFYDSNGPKLTEGKGNGKQSSYYEDKKYFTDKGYADAIIHFQSTGCKANILWWPLTVVGTYWRKKADEEAKVSNNWSKIDISDPNKIEENKALSIPIWAGTWESQLSKLTMIRDIWKWAYIEYGELYPDLRKVWRAMYYYLGGPHVNELD